MPTLDSLLSELEDHSRGSVHLDSADHLSVGIGHRVTPDDALKLGDVIVQERIDELFREDKSVALTAARRQAAKAGITDSDFIVYLAAVNFQLGSNWYREFPKTWGLIKEKKYQAAASEVSNSRWNVETPLRPQTFRDALLSLARKAGLNS